QSAANNRIRSVSVMDSPDPDTAARENGVKEQLVLTSFIGVSDEETRVMMLRKLAGCGISGLCVFHQEEGLGALGVRFADAADKLGCPVILMPYDKAEYAETIEQVMDKILYGDSYENDLINNTIYHLLDFEMHSSFEAALREAAITNSFQVILFSHDFNPILTVETRKRATIADAIRYGKEKGVGKGGIFTFVDVNGVLTYWGPVTVAGEKYFLMIVDNDDNYSAQEITKLAEIIELSMGMWKYTPERDVRAEFVKALMRNNKSLAYSLKDELSIDSSNILSVFYAKGIESKAGNDIIADYEKSRDFEVVRISEGDETNGVILRTTKEEEEYSDKQCCIDLFDDLKEIDKSVRIFHATGLGGIEGAGDAFRLINETWTYVESVFPYKRVFTKYELALVSNCINLAVHGGYQKKNYMDLLEPFNREMGENKAKQLLDTLETFVLDAGMNSGKTSVFMGIHTNTVQYRLKRINEVLGAEITGNRVIPGLTIALALKRLEGVVR
ncbi:MAG: PucR family transcriptional regulator ligand-binding domain-containing protein, partial [Lachnospiraceae bacterium]|nr:PucR family transcriptional regulator ligand-binding domain-containing protein [Lachnospiraceae bacterium]